MSVSSSAASLSAVSLMWPAGQRLAELLHFLSGRADVQAVYLTGSLAREDETVDRWSDVDLTLISTSPEHYHQSDGWLREVSSVAFALPYTPRHQRVLFADGVLLELGVFSEADVSAPHPLLGIGPGRILLDRADLTPQLEAVVRQHTPADWSAARYAEHLAYLLTHLLLVRRRLERGEVLSAHTLYLRFADEVLRFLTAGTAPHQAASSTADPLDHARRFEGRFPELVPLLPRLLPACEAQALRGATDLALSVLETLGREVLTSLEQPFPEAVWRGVRAQWSFHSLAP